MGELVNIFAKKPHMEGPAKCLHCGHTWIAASPVGVTILECPECHLGKATYISFAIPQGQLTWTCDCGGKFFMLGKNATYCIICGATQRLT